MLVDTLGDLADGLSALPARRRAVVFSSQGLDLELKGGGAVLARIISRA